MLNNFRYSLPDELQSQLDASVAEWQDQNKVARVWQKDASVWTGEDEAKWLGWLDVGCRMFYPEGRKRNRP